MLHLRRACSGEKEFGRFVWKGWQSLHVGHLVQFPLYPLNEAEIHTALTLEAHESVEGYIVQRPKEAAIVVLGGVRVGNEGVDFGLHDFVLDAETLKLSGERCCERPIEVWER